jgi:LmbE family N-acetylglucosaminyl deacetylase
MTLRDLLVRHARPNWVRRTLHAVKTGYETFAPVPLLDLPPGQRLCVVAPHPDDESIGCGGLMALWAAEGRSIEVAFLTRGELGSTLSRDATAGDRQRAAARAATARIRQGEAEMALADLGARALWLDGPDGAVHSAEQRLTRSLIEAWTAAPPDLVAAPSPLDRHADHAAAARVVAAAARAALATRRVPVWGYEVWCPVPANGILDVTAHAETKWKAISRHESQLATTDYLSAAKGMATYRAVTAGLGARRVAEAFLVMDIPGYGALADSLRI